MPALTHADANLNQHLNLAGPAVVVIVLDLHDAQLVGIAAYDVCVELRRNTRRNADKLGVYDMFLGMRTFVSEAVDRDGCTA